MMKKINLVLLPALVAAFLFFAIGVTTLLGRANDAAAMQPTSVEYTTPIPKSELELLLRRNA